MTDTQISKREYKIKYFQCKIEIKGSLISNYSGSKFPCIDLFINSDKFR